jgi:hypothetical protein
VQYNFFKLSLSSPPKRSALIHKDKITKSNDIMPTKGAMAAEFSLEELHALIKEAKTWPTKGVFAG